MSATGAKDVDFGILPGPDVLSAEARQVAIRFSPRYWSADVAEPDDIPVPRDLARAVPERQAKEAVFKCLHPLVGRRFGFADARLVRVDGGERTFTIRIATDLSADYPAGTTLMGRFAVEPTMLHTGLLLNADAACDTTG